MNVAVIGLGLIGGSVLRVLAARGHAVTGYDADPATLAEARAAADQAEDPAGPAATPDATTDDDPTGPAAPPDATTDHGPTGPGSARDTTTNHDPTGPAATPDATTDHGPAAGPQAVGRTPAAEQTAGGTPAAGRGRWRVAGSLAGAVAGADLVVLAVPLPAVTPVLGELANTGYTGVITDVTSVKTPVRRLVDQVRRDHPELGAYVGGHPMAGRETSGFGASDPTLFDGCAWVLCLEPGATQLAAWLDLARLVTALGARVVPATAAEHDLAVATVSHVPHLLAAALAAAAADNPMAGTLAAGSFRDGTRVAASPPALVAAMCGGNAPAVAPALDRVRAALDEAGDALRHPDPIAALRPWLEPGCTARAGWPPRPGEAIELPVGVEPLLNLGRAGGWLTSVANDGQTVTAVYPR